MLQSHQDPTILWALNPVLLLSDEVNKAENRVRSIKPFY